MAIFWSVSLTPECSLRVPPMRGCSLDTCVACTWLDLMSSSSLFQDSVICADFWSRQYGPHTTCDRLRWRWPCLPRLRWFDPLLLWVCLVVFRSWLAPQLIPHWDVCWGLPLLDSDCAGGWVAVPSPPRTS